MVDLEEVLYKYYKYKSFRYPQKEIITNVLEKKDTISILPTGGGKSLLFQIPALVFSNISIIITPLISLMIDQVTTLRKRKIPAYYLNSTQADFESKEIIKKLINKEIKILYLSPEKLENKYLKQILLDLTIDMICIDEAHTILWGMDFRQSFFRLDHFIEELKQKPVILAVTATATINTIKKISNVLRLTNPIIIKSPFDRKNLYYGVIKTKNKLDFIKRYINNNIEYSGIIYTSTCKNVEYLFDVLSECFSVTYYHGQLSNYQKIRNQNQFLQDKKKIIIATISFGMGIDKSDIRYVINYDLPQSIEDLVQMQGRASRDGRKGECLLLYDKEDIKVNEYFINNIDVNKREVIRYKLNKLTKIIEYANYRGCLRNYILNYFSFNKTNCNNCSNCKKKK